MTWLLLTGLSVWLRYALVEGDLYWHGVNGVLI
jgi:hypothetical protein